MDVVVFGAGSLGSLVGGLLAREHPVTLVGREAHVRAVRADGLRVTGRESAAVRPDATADGSNLAADLAVVTVKAYDTEAAARTLATGTFDAVLSLQNGMGNEEQLAAVLDAPVLAGTASYGAELVAPGVVECTGTGKIELGDRRGRPSELADRVGRAFDAGGLETTVATDMPRRLWTKLAINAGINPVTALARVENGALVDGGTTARAAARETAAVARSTGVDLSDRAAVDAVERIAAATADNASSMLQDVRDGSRTEIDAINGYVVERGREAPVPVPVNRALASLVRTWESGAGRR